MLLAIDVGNTRIKAAVFEGTTLIEQFVFTILEFQKNMHFILANYQNCTDLIVASVGKLNNNDFLTLDNNIKVHVITNDFPFPYPNLYETPKTLGIDRMVLAFGAVINFPKQNRLIIDAGTCITYDFIDEKDNYLGGAIAPGINLRYASLNNYTANLPLLEVQTEMLPNYIGNSTQQSIHSGVINGVIYELDGFIDQYRQQYPNFIIILTGGDAEFLAKRLKNTIFANSNFLLESLCQTFQYKTKND